MTHVEGPRKPGGSRLTVVVATRNRWPELSVSLSKHEVPVIVVDNGSSDDTPRLVNQHFPDVQVIALNENHGAAGRNIGVRSASTPYIAFADDDSWWAPGALSRAVEVFDKYPRLALLAGHVLVGEEQRPDPICGLMADSPLPIQEDLPGPSVLGFLAGCAIVRREAFLAAGGFDDVVFFMGEEERLALDLAALGWGLAYVDSIIAYHHPSLSRDGPSREVRAARGRLLTAVLRRPWPVVLDLFREQLAYPVGRRAIIQALTEVGQAIALRRTLPPHVEAACKMLERPRGVPR
jgi:GT2 family glycosyltransferase